VDISDAQKEVRSVFLGGFAGQLVSSLVWFASAVLSLWYAPRISISVLVLGGIFIFPMTQLVLRLMGRPASLPKGHPMNALAMQIAFTVPCSLPLVAAASLYRLNWFYPAFMIVVGAHYLPFVFLYGMWQFAVLAGLLIGGGLLIGVYFSSTFAVGGWFTALALLTFAFVGRQVAQQQATRHSPRS
jgi:hypothetical protein